MHLIKSALLLILFACLPFSASAAPVAVAKARAILEYRAAHGPFVSVDQLLEVKGVGPALLEKNRSRIVIE